MSSRCDLDTKGDIYEYMLAKIAAAKNGSSARRATSSS